jgi:hypothetical protein
MTQEDFERWLDEFLERDLADPEVRRMLASLEGD